MYQIHMLNVVIMCGGNGTRLWPLSRDKLPKQFLKVTNKDHTMFQLTCLRVKNIDLDTNYFEKNSDEKVKKEDYGSKNEK